MKRTITVFNQNTQEKKVFQDVDVSTVGQLKSFMTTNGYILDNMDLREGVSRTDLKTDSQTLPHDIPYKGSLTDDLLIFMTLKNKNIHSGMDRKEAVEYMKKNHLEDAVKAAYGDNWTRVSTANLVAFCEKVQKNGSKSSSNPSIAVNKSAKDTPANNANGPVDAIVALAGLLADNGTIKPAEAAQIQEIARKTVGYSMDDIRELM